ncbi:MAG: hypothetical protein IKN54_05415, partial [Lachnospiraceae bacterium]|nr:hypothetical protein [Lachnospiraceae bacterium]
MRAVIRNSVIVFMLMVGISAAVFCDDTVVVRAEPQKEVASIEYQLSKSIELYEQGDGIWTEDEMGHSFFEYQFYTDMLGNKLIVNYTDKTHNIYTYKICPYTDSERNKYDI